MPCTPFPIWEGLRQLTAVIFLSIIALTPASLPAQASGDSLQLLQTLAVRANYVAVDNLSNVYLISPENAVEKYAPDGRRLSRYTNNRLGRAMYLDVSNPLKVVVWYADFRTAVFLDRSLTDLGELNLIVAGYPEVRTVAAAQDGNLWLYDEANFRLAKITPEGEKRYESQAMNLLEPTPTRPTCIREGNDRVMMADSVHGVFAFDFFAQFDRVFIPQQPVFDFQIVGNQMHYLSDGKIVEEHLQVRASQEVSIAAEILENRKALLSGGRLIVFWEEAVMVYGY